MTAPMTILLVEDEALIMLGLVETLEEGGYGVVTASSGPEALQILTEQQANLRALVTDVDIGPGGVSGWDVAKKAREARPDLPVVYMTGASADQWAARGVPNSVLLGKPFADAQLITAVSQLLNAHPTLPQV